MNHEAVHRAAPATPGLLMIYTFFNRPNVDGAVFQTPLSLIDNFFDSSSKSSNYHKSQIVRDRELKKGN